MDINGPLTVAVAEPTPGGDYQLHLTFNEDFRATDLVSQGQVFTAYVAELNSACADPELDERTRQGMLLIEQIGEHLLPHVVAGDIPLSETLIIDVQRAPGVNLIDLLGR